MSEFRYHTLSITGRRETNQDCVIAKEVGKKAYFLAVADGMGGVAGGQVASNLILQTAEKVLTEQFTSPLKPEKLKETLEIIFLEAQMAIKKRIKEEPELTGMGTTLTCVLIIGNKYAWGNLGDSRIYSISNGKLNLITKDHTYIQDYIDKNGNTLSADILNKYSNYLLKTIDGGTDVADIYPFDADYLALKNGELFLLCSDGLILNKSDFKSEFIKDYILESKNLEIGTKNLVDYVFKMGSNDNISVVVGEYGKHKIVKRKSVKKKSSKKILTIIPIIASLLFIFLVYLLVSPYIFQTQNEKDFVEVKRNKNVHPEIKFREEKPAKEKKKTSTNKVEKKAEDNKIEAPNLVGKSKTVATATAKVKGLKVAVKNVPSNSKQKGLVISQSPGSGSKVKKGSTIAIKIGEG